MCYGGEEHSESRDFVGKLEFRVYYFDPSYLDFARNLRRFTK